VQIASFASVAWQEAAAVKQEWLLEQNSGKNEKKKF
jgi:hypothetical protein